MPLITIFKDDKTTKKTVFQILKVAQSTTSSVDDKIESDCGFEGSQICYEQNRIQNVVSLPIMQMWIYILCITNEK